MRKIIVALLILGTFPFVSCSDDSTEIPDSKPENPRDPSEKSSPYITKVLDYRPAVGQFTNVFPEYKEGDTQETMNQKVLELIGGDKKGMITLGGFGGYVVVGFDHTIQNVPGKRDFRVLGNAFYNAAANASDPDGGSCEPGVIMVSYDKNGNGKADDEWFEIAGSSHVDATKEPWYEMAKAANNDVVTHFNYDITYYRPASEPKTEAEMETYIKWEDNLNNEGFKKKNKFHSQCYYPKWIKEDKLTFKGITCLPQNGIDTSGNGSLYVLYKFNYGYADNELNNKTDSGIDIDWAVDSNGKKADLAGVDFIKIYTGVNQENGDIGECSTEITGVEDLHLLNVDLPTR